MTELGVLLGGDRNVTQRSMLNVIELEQRIANVRTRSLSVLPKYGMICPFLSDTHHH